MRHASSGLLERFRQPEYVGENRCVPCTVVNVVIALVATGALVAGLSIPADVAVAGALGGAFLVVSLLSIYLRGYLVPGTPTLTKRYFPDRVLRWFEKEPEAVDAPVAGSAGDIEAEPILLEAGAVEFCKGGEDLCPTDSFSAGWREEVEALRDGGDLPSRMAEILEADEADVEVVEGEEFAVVQVDDQAVARWESMAALLADAAAYPWLSERVDGWGQLDLRDRGQLLNGARVFIDRCPDCGGDVGFAEETRESCCREIEVITMECSDCGARLLEVTD